MKEIKNIDKIMIKLASPEQIRAWSYGEVKKPETINYRTLRPERDGLFCERIFGTTKQFECYCGKFKSRRYKGVICDRCGVEIADFKIRRERMGHIELACPVSHIWYYRSVPSRIGILLGLSVNELRSVLYYEKHIVINAGDTDLKPMQLLSEEEYLAAVDQFGEGFTAGIGGEAIRSLLKNLDLDALALELRQNMADKGAKSDSKLLKRITIVENFRDSGNRPEWMVMDVIPVIPPDLRPMVQLDGGRFASSDLNDLYRRVINRNNRLKKLMALHAPEMIIRNEKRMLQEAVDALFDNSKKTKSVKGASNRSLRSLSDMLKGKQGRFRQNLLGKRVDYSGRSVIVVGPELKLHQCGLPVKMALELFKPFLIKRLLSDNVVPNIKKAKTLIEKEAGDIFELLQDVVREHPVLLNRAPTLHRLGIQAFEPVLVEGKAIKLHPLVCTAFNADFDGDQMPVHVPLTQAAQIECWTLMLSSRNLLDPANGNPIVFPSQDMVLGIYYLTKEKPGSKGENKFYSSTGDLQLAIDSGVLEYAAKIRYKLADGSIIQTTPGRVFFNEAMPEVVPFQNECFTSKKLQSFIAETLHQYGQAVGVDMLDRIKDVGFRYATIFGATIGVSDIVVPESKPALIKEANEKVEKIYSNVDTLSADEKHNRVIKVWEDVNEKLTDEVMEKLRADRDGFNPVFMMADSGARGSRTQIRQLSGMRGLMAKPNGDIIALPIRSNFREGLSIIEFFISTNGARKGLADTALKTASAGYLTRRLVDIAQDVVINDIDCQTINGLEMFPLKDGERIVETISDRVVGRFALDPVYHPITGDIIVDANEEITDEIAAVIEKSGIESVSIRSVLSCESSQGVCQMCYGRNLANNKTVNIGEAVGIIAAQSIGQPGTQLTMRTFHVGGVATKTGGDNEIVRDYPVMLKSIQGNTVPLEQDPSGAKLLFTRKGNIVIARVVYSHKLAGCEVLVQEGDKVSKGSEILKAKDGVITAPEVSFVHLIDNELVLLSNEQKISIQNGSKLMEETGSIIAAGQTIVEFDPFGDPIIAEFDGKVVYKDLVLGTTLRLDAENNNAKRITEFISEEMQPRLIIVNPDNEDEEYATYHLPGGALLADIENGELVKRGKTLAKITMEGVKTRDITGGLARVEDLFEARNPKDTAILSQVSGTVKFAGIAKGKRIIEVSDNFGNAYKHLVPLGKYLLVRDGDLVSAGEPLTSGDFNPHEILEIMGERELQSYLLNEVQEVYRLAGVTINDKHISVIIRQMMRKVQITEVGDTKFIYGQQVDKFKFWKENQEVMEKGGEPAVARPLLLGITRASLSVDSFISAASFQETTKVLTNAAIAGSTDELLGLKENISIGHQIPAGTGMRRYRNIKIYDENMQEIDVALQQAMEERRLQQKEQAAERERAVLDTEIEAQGELSV